MDWLYDERTQCWSVMTTLPVGEYTHLVSDAHEAQGALSGQRAVMTTTTAKRIRTRMVEDLTQGAILPPVVIGAVLPGGSLLRATEARCEVGGGIVGGRACALDY